MNVPDGASSTRLTAIRTFSSNDISLTLAAWQTQQGSFISTLYHTSSIPFKILVADKYVAIAILPAHRSSILPSI